MTTLPVQASGSTLRKRGGSEQPESSVDQVKETVKKEVQKLKLYVWDELPDWQKDNCYILSGYVRETFSYLECLRSLTYLHNESVNIYSHLIPGVLFLIGCFSFFNKFMESYETTTWKDNAVFSIFSFGAATALTLSSSFHCLKCHSEQVATFGNKLDYLGIIVLIVTSMVSLLYYALMDQKMLRNFFWGLTMILGAICAVFSLKDKFRTNKWRPYRALMFVLFGLSGILPIVTGCYIYGAQEVCDRAQLSWIISEGVLYCFGAFLYAARLPERYNPGTYDMFGHSHQIFHVLVVVAACCHGRGLIGSYKYSHEHTIPINRKFS